MTLLKVQLGVETYNPTGWYFATTVGGKVKENLDGQDKRYQVTKYATSDTGLKALVQQKQMMWTGQETEAKRIEVNKNYQNRTEMEDKL